MVFILGAGASAPAGAPTMVDFIDRAEDLQHTGRLGDDDEHFSTFFKGRAALQAVYAKAMIDIDNLESLFVAFEIAKLLRRFPGLQLDDVDALLPATRRVISRTLEESILYPVVAEGKIHPHVSCDGLAQRVQQLRNEGHSVSIITFNYDYSLDYALAWQRIPVDYCLDSDRDHTALPLLKMHGSLSWRRTQNDAILIHAFHPMTIAGIAPDLYHESQNSCRIRCQDFFEAAATEPVLVPPTWNKLQSQMEIQPVWQKAAELLSGADTIVVAGYSLPETDHFFRYLYALGVSSSVRLRRLWVFDKYPTDALYARYRRMFGPLVVQKFQVFEGDFQEIPGVFQGPPEKWETLVTRRPFKRWNG